MTDAERHSLWRKANPDKEREYQRTYYEKHKAKKREANRKWHAAHPEAKNIYQRRRLGCKNPNGKIEHGPCEICGKVCDLRYDHDHTTGEFRGWLCNNCNMKLDWYIEQRKGIERYVKKNESSVNSRARSRSVPEQRDAAA